MKDFRNEGISPMKKKMRFQILASVISIFTVASSFATVNPIKGTYIVTSGNNDSICPQILKPYFWEDSNSPKLSDSDKSDEKTLVGIDVIYSGDCADQGPFNYGCIINSDNATECGSPSNVSFLFKDDRHYTWTNHGYDIYGEFELSER